MLLTQSVSHTHTQSLIHKYIQSVSQSLAEPVDGAETAVMFVTYSLV